MEQPTGGHDWELLHGAASPTAAASDAFVGVEGDADGAIKSDYFALNSGDRYTRRASTDEESGSLPDSDNPSWVDPVSDSCFLGEPSRGELGFGGSGFPRADPGGFWTSDESSDGQESPPPPPPDHVKGDLAGGVSLPSESALEGVDVEEIQETNVAEGGSEESGEPLKGPKEENTGLRNQTVAGGGKAGMGWWKLPVEILKFCAFRMKPVWSISIAAALVGIVMLGRRLYRKKPKSKSLPVKVSVDDKKVSQFMGRAVRLNEVFSAVKRAPIIRSTLPTVGVTPWPVVALR